MLCVLFVRIDDGGGVVSVGGVVCDAGVDGEFGVGVAVCVVVCWW